MKKLLGIFGSLVLISMLTMLAGTSSAYGGQWMWVHGHSGHFWAGTELGGGTYTGQPKPSNKGLYIPGLSIQDLNPLIPPGTVFIPRFVYYAVPTISGGAWAARTIKILVGGFDDPATILPGVVTQVTVNNGDDTVKTFPGAWGGPGYHEIVLDLGGNLTFSKGLGIELKLLGGVLPQGQTPAMYNGSTVTIIAAGAEFIQGADITPANSLLLRD
jgi:hypothetical protein